MRLKDISVEKSNLFAYLCFCVFCARKENKIEKKKNEKSYNWNVLNTDVPINHFRCLCVYLRELVCGETNLVYILTL